MLTDWNFWFSLITAVVAIIALFLSVIQIRVSNKQSLFDRRLGSYLKIDGLMKLYMDNKAIIEKENNEEPRFAVDLEFLWLTNNTYLEDVGEAIKKPLEKPGHKKLLMKREELKQLALSTELLFKGKSSTYMSRFILAYENLLFKMYQYRILLNNMSQYSEQYKATIEAAQKAVDEPTLRKELIKAYIEIKESYSLAVQEKAMEILKRQIKL